jgi:hypothetical protein
MRMPLFPRCELEDAASDPYGETSGWICLRPTKTSCTAPGHRKRSERSGAPAGLKFGVYLSPRDRNNALYGTPAYSGIYREQLRELLTHTGRSMRSGANDGDGYYGCARERRTIDKRTCYDWPKTWELVRSFSRRR